MRTRKLFARMVVFVAHQIQRRLEPARDETKRAIEWLEKQTICEYY